MATQGRVQAKLQAAGRGVLRVAEGLAALEAASWPLYLAPEEKWYRAGNRESGVRQFIVQDPDGYLLRFQESLGLRQHPSRIQRL